MGFADLLGSMGKAVVDSALSSSAKIYSEKAGDRRFSEEQRQEFRERAEASRAAQKEWKNVNSIGDLFQTSSHNDDDDDYE